MTGDRAAAAAAALFVIGLFAMFGARALLHRRRTGSAGFRGLSGAPGSAGWWGGLLFIAALVLAGAGLWLALADVVPAASSVPDGVRFAGLALAVPGFLAVLAGQSGMGPSWRIGVDETERTELVTTGLFSVSRNPIFAAMCLALAGLAVMVPTVVMVISVMCLVAAVQLQVRVVEEPYLLATHGAAYASYARRVGRFVPRVGLLDSTPTVGASR
ncbi:isoprenylcysteine carboxylmethyltransferase family protein [Actinotalea ferrariae]|nr:isoprenylcysteine carboxylmethyltransferase family protein [Actinotalea ferrariae]